MISRSTSTVNQDGHTLSSVQGNIEFRNVYFSYLSRPEIPILSGFYLTVPARKTVALVGRNGSGKSSIIPLMERFYDPTLGIVVAISLHSVLIAIFHIDTMTKENNLTYHIINAKQIFLVLQCLNWELLVTSAIYCHSPCK